MKFLAIFFLALAAATAADVTVKFDYDFTSTRACSASVTADCLDSFEVGTLDGTAFTSLLSLPLPSSTSGVVTGITGTFILEKYGPKTLSAIAVAKDGQGARITSDPTKATVTAVITPKAPRNVTIVVVVVQAP